MKLDKEKYLESRSVKPRSLFLSLLLINLLLGLISYYFPSDGVSLTGGIKLKFLSLNNLLIQDSTETATVALEDVLGGVEPIISDTGSASVTDSTFLQDAENIVYTEVPKYRQIWMPENNPEALTMLINALKVESKKKVVRILHYGDSQIEGDRVTNYLRFRIQETFGGSGAGILLPKEPAADSRRNYLVSESDNIIKHAIYGKTPKPHNNVYGLGGTAYTINGKNNHFLRWDTLSYKDSTGHETISIEARFSDSTQSPNYIKISNRGMGYSRSRKHSKITLLYENNEYAKLALTYNGKSHDYILKPRPNGGLKTWNTSANKSLKFSFVKGQPPKIYGIAFDGKIGVAVDNFGMRGSSGQGFSGMNNTRYAEQLRQMNVRGIIMQYGVNVVPNAISDYSYYKRSLVSQFKALKKAYPGISIIVVGPNDMSKNDDGEYSSYENIPRIRDAMKAAALESGCCFWDLYKAMGGENAMKEWVNKGLAQKDYTHFTYKGAKYVGEMLYEAIIDQVNKKAN